MPCSPTGWYEKRDPKAPFNKDTGNQVSQLENNQENLILMESSINWELKRSLSLAKNIFNKKTLITFMRYNHRAKFNYHKVCAKATEK